MQFWPDVVPILLVVGVYLGGQALDAGFLSPNIVGSKIGLHPVWLIFSLFVFSYLFGFVGALVAVPLAAAIAVLMRFCALRLPQEPSLSGRRGPSSPYVHRSTRRRAMTAGASQSPKQLVLELPHRQALGAEDFLVSRSNAAAVEMVDAWPSWSHPAALVAGPKGAGKSHLAHVWQLKSGARSVAAAEYHGRCDSGSEKAGRR